MEHFRIVGRGRGAVQVLGGSGTEFRVTLRQDPAAKGSGVDPGALHLSGDKWTGNSLTFARSYRTYPPPSLFLALANKSSALSNRPFSRAFSATVS